MGLIQPSIYDVDSSSVQLLTLKDWTSKSVCLYWYLHGDHGLYARRESPQELALKTAWAELEAHAKVGKGAQIRLYPRCIAPKNIAAKEDRGRGKRRSRPLGASNR